MVVGFEIKQLKVERDKRISLAAQLHIADPRRLYYLPGDYDDIPICSSSAENERILAMHGFDKVLMAKGGKA